MPTITILPHETLCPDRLTFAANPGDNLLQVLLMRGIHIEHACEGQGTCSTCHVYIRKGIEKLNPVKDLEDETLNRAWGLDLDSRLSCQVTVGHDDLTIEIPRYTLNQVSEAN